MRRGVLQRIARSITTATLTLAIAFVGLAPSVHAHASIVESPLASATSVDQSVARPAPLDLNSLPHSAMIDDESPDLDDHDDVVVTSRDSARSPLRVVATVTITNDSADLAPIAPSAPTRGPPRA